MRRVLKNLAVCAIAALASACGGGGGSQDNVGGGPPPAPNRLPEVKPPGITVPDFIGGHPVDLDVTQFFTDPDGDALTYRIEFRSPEGDGSWNGLRIANNRVVGIPAITDGFTFANTFVLVNFSDGRGGTNYSEFRIVIKANSSPVVVQPNVDQIVTVGAAIDFDASTGGQSFADPDGDPLTYELVLGPAARGLAADGARVHGALDSYGAVYVRVIARDAFGGSVENRFAIAAPIAETRIPVLPTVSYIYDDAELALPYVARRSREIFASLWDTSGTSGNATTNAGATLGRVLFYDKRLSITNKASCGSCHQQAHGFASPERFSAGPQGELTRRNVMGLTDVRYNLDNLYFSDRRVTSLEQLVREPIGEPTELGISMPMLVDRLAATDFYPPLFTAAFGTPEITADRITKAIAQFLRSLIAFDSRFDAAMHPMGADDVATPEAVFTPLEFRGSQVFNGAGRCTFCHQQGAQTMDPILNNALDVTPLDPGSGQGNFRAASLRNIAVTAPYMHDGRFATLREVIEHYSSGIVDTPQVDVRLRGMNLNNSPNSKLSDEDKDALEAFLHTLTDEHFLADPKFSDPFL